MRWLVVVLLGLTMVTACTDDSADSPTELVDTAVSPSPEPPSESVEAPAEPADSPSESVEIIEVAAGLPPGVEQAGDPADEAFDSSAGAGISSDGENIWIVTSGSINNPMLPREVTVDGQTLTFTLDFERDQMSTSDFSPTTSTVAVPPGVSRTEPIEIVLTDVGTVTIDPSQAGSFAWVSLESTVL